MTAKAMKSAQSKNARALPRFQDMLNQKIQDPKFAKLLDEERAALRLGLALCEAREQAKLTQQEMESRTGIPQETLSRIERGRMPSMVTLQKLARALESEVRISPDGRVSIEPVGELEKAA